MSKDEELVNRTLSGLLTGQQTMSGSLSRMSRVLIELTEEVDILKAASSNQEALIKDLMDVMTAFTETSADTRKRLAALEADRARLEALEAAVSELKKRAS